jgi:type VI secretion system protein ImpL
MEELELNGNLVQAVRDILADRSLAERVYQSIITSPEAEEIPDWRITQAGGPQTTRVLIRPSGEPLSEGVEGIFTYRGWTEVFRDEALGVAQRMQREAWVFGEGAQALTDDALGNLTRDVLNLYYDDYVARWDRLLADIDIVPASSARDAARITNILAGANSPIKNILESVADETELTRVPEAPEGTIAVDEATQGALGEVFSRYGKASLDQPTRDLLNAMSGGNGFQTLATASEEELPPLPGQYVEDQFAWLRDLTRSEEGVPSPLDDVVRLIGEVNDELDRLGGGGDTAIIRPGEEGAPSRLEDTAAELDRGPLQRWAMQVVNSTEDIGASGARSKLNQLWQAEVLPLCERALDGRYPFDPGAAADVTLQDFERLFAPGGLIDGFFKEHLLEYVDTTAKPWQFKRVGGADLGISTNVLTQFQHAADIRDSFFLGAGPPKLTFDLKPLALDSKATSVILEVEGQTLEYAHQVPETTPMTWPGEAGGRTRVSFTPQLPDAENSMSREGPWAWFRLLDAAEMRRTNVSDRSRVVFTIGGRIAVFQLRAGSALNPFSLPALRSFRCVKSL